MLLDTNVYSGLARGLQTAIDAIRDADEIKLPLPVIAELRYGFLKGSQNEKNERTLQKFLSQPNIYIASPSVKTTEIYAELQLYCTKRGKALSHNDIWIASLAYETDDILITFDKDFSVFSDLFGERLVLLD
jgi:tRNA(fMet)-specific endonuclease VapC